MFTAKVRETSTVVAATRQLRHPSIAADKNPHPELKFTIQAATYSLDLREEMAVVLTSRDDSIDSEVVTRLIIWSTHCKRLLQKKGMMSMHTIVVLGKFRSGLCEL